MLLLSPVSKISLRQVAAEEILSSEQTYVEQIRLCIGVSYNSA